MSQNNHHVFFVVMYISDSVLRIEIMTCTHESISLKGKVPKPRMGLGVTEMTIIFVSTFIVQGWFLMPGTGLFRRTRQSTTSHMKVHMYNLVL